jgi:coatomer protein complex subunit alpha (xenin)
LDKLKKMEKFAEKRADPIAVFHNALYLGDIPTRIKTLEMTGQLPLAYLTAKTHGLAEDAERIKSRLESRLSSEQQQQNGQEASPIDLDSKMPFTKNARMMLPPMPFLRNEEGTWPLLALPRGPFDAFLNAASAAETSSTLQLGSTSYVPETGADISAEGEGDWVDDDVLGEGAVSGKAASNKTQGAQGDAVVATGETEGDWELESGMESELPPLAKPTVEGPPPVTLPRESPPARSLWLNSEIPADHAAAGSFETAMKLLNAQIGVVNFAPLKSHFISLASATHVLLSALPSTSALEVPLQRNWATTPFSAAKEGLPVIAINFPQLVEKLQAGYRAFTGGKFQEALDLLRSILHALPLIALSNPAEAAEAKELIGIVVDYILGLQIELKRKEIAASDPSQLSRIAELGAYFTHCNLQPNHLALTLRSAMNAAVKMRNFASAYNFGRRLLDLAPKPEVATTAQRVLQLCEQSGLKDEIQIDYDERNPFVICATSMVPIYRGTPSTLCPYCGAHYQQQHAGSLCVVCQLSKVGAPATGLNIHRVASAPKRPQKRSLLDD